MKVSTITAAIQAATVVTVTPSSSGDMGSRDMAYFKALADEIGSRLKQLGLTDSQPQLRWENGKFDKDYWVVTLSGFIQGKDKLSIQLLFLDGSRGYLLEGYRLFRNGNKLITSKTGIHDRKELVADLLEEFVEDVKPVMSEGDEVFSLTHPLMLILVCGKTDLYRAVTKVNLANSKTVAIFPYNSPAMGRAPASKGYAGFATSVPLLNSFKSEQDLLKYADTCLSTYRGLPQCRDDDEDMGHWKSFTVGVYDLKSRKILCRDDHDVTWIKKVVTEYPQLVF